METVTVNEGTPAAVVDLVRDVKAATCAGDTTAVDRVMEAVGGASWEELFAVLVLVAQHSQTPPPGGMRVLPSDTSTLTTEQTTAAARAYASGDASLPTMVSAIEHYVREVARLHTDLDRARGGRPRSRRGHMEAVNDAAMRIRRQGHITPTEIPQEVGAQSA